MASSLSTDQDIQLTAQSTPFDSDQILMHQIELCDSDIAISQDCHSIELETSDEMIAACDQTQNIINYTIIGNGLILIEGSQVDFDDETKDSMNDLRPLKGTLIVFSSSVFFSGSHFIITALQLISRNYKCPIFNLDIVVVEF